MKRAPANWIWGWHSLEACLERYPELIKEVLLESEGPAVERAQKALRQAGLKFNTVNQLPAEFAERRAQGVLARLESFPFHYLKDYRDDAFVGALRSRTPQFALLDGIEDPRNYGAVVRSAAAFGIQALFVGERRQAPLTGVVAQASAGQLFRSEIVLCNNVKHVLDLEAFQEGAIWALDADGESLPQAVGQHPKGQPILWVLGAEGEGVSPSIKERCHKVLSIPMVQGVESLNASVAASIAFYQGFLRSAQ